MLRVPRFRQPDEVSCLPTCVYAVLVYEHGLHIVTYEEIARICRLDAQGAVDYVAVQSLSESEWDVEMLDGLDLDDVKTILDEDRPVILILGQGEHLAHAVVACDVTAEALVVMDPAVGDYREIQLSDEVLLVESAFMSGLLISGSPAISSPVCQVL